MAPTNEFAVTGGLRVDDFGSSPLPYTQPSLDDNFASLTGVLAFRNANTKIGPRSAADVVLGPPHLAKLGPDGFVRAGLTGSSQTIPTSAPMVIHLTAPATVAMTVTLTSGDPATLTVDSPVMLNPGDQDVPIKVTGVMRNPTAVTISATANGVTRTGSVRVLGDGVTADKPTFTTLTPATGKVAFGGTINLTAALDLPAAAAVPFTVMSASGWTVPATPPTIPVDELSVAIPITQTGSTLTDTITVSDGTTPKTSMLSVNVHPVINEVDYDMASTDLSEFIEIYNPNPVSLDLSNFAVVLATNGANEYLRVPLTGVTLDAGSATPPPGSFLVIGTATLNATLPAMVHAIAFAKTQDNITNTSSNPTGIAIIDTTNNTVVDSVSFGPGTAGVVAQITGFTGKTTFAEGTFKSINDSGTAKSCARHPNGHDSDDLATDWTLQATPNPGAANP